MTAPGRLVIALLAGAALLPLACSNSSGDGDRAAAVAEPQAAGAAGAGAAPTVDSTTSTTEVRSGPDGPFAVGRHDETFVDTTRPTSAGGSNPGAATRTLATAVYYPAAGAPGSEVAVDAAPLLAEGPFPLVELSHGWTASGPVYESLAKEWAAAGYVVAAPTFPASSGPGGSQLGDFVNQPADVSFVLDELLESVVAGDGFLDGLVDTERIGIAGHSLGGITTVGATMSTCCRDDRVDAAVAMAPPLFLKFPTGVFDGENPPALFMNGDQDTLVPLENSQTAYATAEAPKFLVTIYGGTHSGPFLAGRSGPQGTMVVDGTIAFFDFYLKDRPDGLDRLQAAVQASGSAALEQDVATD